MKNSVCDIFGFEEIDNVLKQLPKQYSKEIINNTLAKAGRDTVLKDAKRLVPVAEKEWEGQSEGRQHNPGNLRKSLGVMKSRKGIGVLIGVRSKMFRRGSVVSDGWYAHMVEYGHWLTDKKKNRSQVHSPSTFYETGMG